MTSDRPTRVDLWLLTSVLLGIGLRLLYYTAPYADAHRWRQVENLAIAWNFYDRSLNPFYPEAIWAGLSGGYVEMEFPFVPWLLAASWRMFGFHELFGRAIAIIASVVLILAIYQIGKRLFGPGPGRAAAFLIAVSPTAVFFGRVPMTDTPMIACSTVAVMAYLFYFSTSHVRWAILGGAAALGAWLLKIPSLLILGPIAIIAYRARGLRLLMRDTAFIGSLAAAFVLAIAWYWHADQLFRATEWTVGIWHRAGMHPMDIARFSPQQSDFSLWSSWRLLTSPEFYQTLGERLWLIHLTPGGLLGVMLGVVLAFVRPGGIIPLIWFAAALAFIFVVGHGNFWHEYYQLPLLPPAALLFGIGAGALFENRSLSNDWRSRLVTWTTPVILIVFAISSFYFSEIIRSYFRPETRDNEIIASGTGVASAVAPTNGLIVVEYEEGTNSPMLLYFAKRRGWSFDTHSISPAAITYLKSKGATHFATTIYSLLEDKRPEVIEFLKTQHEVVLPPGTPEETRLFALD